MSRAYNESAEDTRGKDNESDKLRGKRDEPMASSKIREIQFSDSDIVNQEDWVPRGESNPHNVRPYLFHNHGFVLAVVFAHCLQDALDIAADSGKIDHFKIDLDSSERDDYLTSDVSEADSTFGGDCPEFVNDSGVKYWWRKGVSPSFLGNASEPFDIENVGFIELPNPPASFCAQFNAR